MRDGPPLHRGPRPDFPIPSAAGKIWTLEPEQRSMGSGSTRVVTRWLPLAGCLAACAGAHGDGVARPEAPSRPAAAVASAEADPCDWESGGQRGLPRCPNTGDPVPDPPVTDAACRDQGPGATRWLAMAPHTPLAITDRADGIWSAGQPCCAPWARRGARYRSLDAFGQVAGVVAVAGGEGYDVTACFELSLERLSGRDAGLVYASEDGDWLASPSAEWRPEAGDVSTHERFVGAVMQVAVVDPDATRHFDRDEPLPPLAERTIFFRTEGAGPDGEGTSTDHYAVSGGRLLLVAWRSPDGRWVLVHMENDLTNVEHGPVLAYRPVAVFDMDRDGLPEIVFHWDEGPGWGQVVLRSEQRGGPWRVVAESVGGATL